MAKTMGANEMTGWEKPQHYNFLERWAMKRKTTLNTLILIFIIVMYFKSKIFITS